MLKNHSVVILAAGKSSRMGNLKFLLKYNERFTFIEKIIDTYQNYNCKEIVVVLNKEGVCEFRNLQIKNMTNIKVVENKHLEYERFYSIKLGFNSINDKANVFLQNSDNPFVIKELLQALCTNMKTYDFIKPNYKNKGGHPILLSAKLVELIKKEGKNDLNLKEYLKKFNGEKLKVNDKNILININTVSDYDKLFGG